MLHCDIKYILTVLLLATPFAVSANMIWPSLYILQDYYSWYIILTGLTFETIAAHIFLKTGWLRSLGIMAATNAIYAFNGLLLIPARGIAVEFLMLPFGGGTFQISHWILDYLCVVLANTCIEGLSLKWIFKYSFKSSFLWMAGANSISVILCAMVSIL